MNSVLPAPASATLHRIRRIQAITIGWMSAEAVLSLSAAWMARSPVLLAFGGDSAIELLSAVVVYRRFSAKRQETSERLATRIAGSLLFVLAAYVALIAILALLGRGEARPSLLGILVLIDATLVIRAENAGRKVQELDEDESYTLEITASRATLTAPNALGVLHGLQTFLQLIEPTPAGFAVPVIAIHDQPRFAWRGLLIDVSRHFIPIEVLKRNLDGM